MSTQSFQRGIDPKRAMTIGRIALIKEWLDNHKIKNFTVNEDFTIDVGGDVWLEGYHLNDVAQIPDYIRFGKVNGKFVLTNNK